MRLVRNVMFLMVLALVVSARPALAGGPITSGSTVAGSLAGPSFLESWTFSGTSGQRVLISAVTTSGAVNTNINLKAPGGASVASTSADRLEWQMLSTGTYTIEITDVGVNDPGAYNLTFVNLTVGPYTSGGDPDGGAIVSSDVKTGTMSGASDIDAFTFTGTINDRVLIDAVTTSGSMDTWIYLYPP
ncbi:MAG: hypothetical protein ACKVU1_05615, partial [bacterium]